MASGAPEKLSVQTNTGEAFKGNERKKDICLMDFKDMLSGGDLRSIGKSNIVVSAIRSQQDFDRLFECLYYNERLVVMRAADAIEKITIQSPDYLKKYKEAIIKLCRTAENKELQWHLALLIPRLSLDKKELSNVWNILIKWTKDKNNSRIVRVNALQALFELNQMDNTYNTDFYFILEKLGKENISSIQARIRLLKNEMMLT